MKTKIKSLVFILIFNSFLLCFNDYKQKISDYNLFSGDPHKLITTSNYTTYEIITPLFSDYAYKHRAIYIPTNKKIIYNDKDVFDFPLGTIIAKTFYYPYDFNDSSKGISLKETRIMIHREDGWIGLPYVWNNDETEAFLEVAGDIKKAKWIDKNNSVQSINYIVPNLNQCKGCHLNNNIFKPIGPTARQLNMDFSYKDEIKNQLVKWIELGYFSNTPDIFEAPKIAEWDDPRSGNLNARARAWLDINCAHCHNEFGPANNTGLFLDYYEKDDKKLGIYKTPVAAGRGSGHLRYDIVPGKPNKSILVYRFDSTEPAVMMPELGRTMVHKEGLELIKQWIISLQ